MLPEYETWLRDSQEGVMDIGSGQYKKKGIQSMSPPPNSVNQRTRRERLGSMVGLSVRMY